MRASLKALAALFALAVSSQPLAAQEEFTPEFGVLEGAELTHFLTRNFDAYSLPTGKFTRDAQPVETVEGAVREFVYRLEGEISTLEALRNYERGFADAGYEELFECAGDECGGFDFRFGVYLVAPPAMRFDLADFRYLGVRNEESGRVASVIASRLDGKLFVQVIAVQSEATPDIISNPTPAPGAKPGKAGLFALARRMTEVGHSPIEGVDFEAGSARLTKAALPAVDEVAALVKERPDLRFLVVGHTDDQGDLEVNLKLSLARAQAVRDRLIAGGVGAEQLEAHGVGFLSPRAANQSEEGRALNRRVELVLR